MRGVPEVLGHWMIYQRCSHTAYAIRMTPFTGNHSRRFADFIIIDGAYLALHSLFPESAMIRLSTFSIFATRKRVSQIYCYRLVTVRPAIDDIPTIAGLRSCFYNRRHSMRVAVSTTSFFRLNYILMLNCADDGDEAR